jgi:hypothetical protein
MVIDLLIDEGEVSMDSAALRQLAARLNGVHLADTTGNWNVCNAISYVGPNNSLLPKSLLTKTLKQAAQFDTLTKKTSAPRKPNNYRNYDKSNNDNDGNNGGGYFSGVRRDRRPFNRNHTQPTSTSHSSSSASGAPSTTSASGSGRQ